MRKTNKRMFRALLFTLLVLSMLLSMSVPALAEKAVAADKLVQCDNVGAVTSHTAITGVNLPVVFDDNTDYTPISVDAGIFSGGSSVKELTGLTSSNLKISLGAVTNYDYDTVYEIKYRAHYIVVGEGTKIIEEWKSTDLYFKVEAVAVTRAILSTGTGTFDKYAPADVKTIVTWNDATKITDIKAGSASIGTGSYSVTAIDSDTATLAIKEGYLATQSIGTLTLTIEFYAGNSATLAINITDTSPAGTAPTITTNSLDDGTVGTSYSQTLMATGTSLTWSVYSGDLPSGLTLNGSIISGTPTTSGTFSFTVKAINSKGNDTKALSIYISPASSGNNGDNNGGSSGGSISSTTPTIAPDKKPDQPVIAASQLTPTVDKNGKAAITVPLQTVVDTINKAIAEATKQGRTANGIGVSIDVKNPDGTETLGIVLIQPTLKILTESKVQQFEINGGLVSLGLNLEALKEIQKQSTGDVTVTLTPATGLSKEAQALIGTRSVYNITISYIRDGKNVNITSLGRGNATLSIPYTPGNNEAVGYLFGVYVDGNGSAIRIPGSTYDANSGGIIFDSNHFSMYGVGYIAPSAKFTDISTHWAKESIDYVVGRGLFSGTSDTTFSPDTAMSRGMLVTALGRLAGADVSGYKTSSFTDVKADSTFLPYIEWAYKKGIISGIGNSQFAPDRAVTREEIAVILQNYAQATGYTLPITREAANFADSSSISSSFKDAVKAMQQAGIMSGKNNGYFDPKGTATRAEAAAMLHRYIKLSIDPATGEGWGQRMIPASGCTTGTAKPSPAGRPSTANGIISM